MDIRRGLMMAMANGCNVPDGYKVMKITNPQAISLGDGLFNLLSNTMPTTLVAFGILDCEEFPTQNGYVYMFHWDGTSNSVYFRRTTSSIDINTPRPMTSTYTCKIDAGATFTVYYR